MRSSRAVAVAGLVVSTRVLSPRYGFLRGAWEQYCLSGLRYTAYLACLSLQRVRPGAIPVLATRNVNDAEARQFLERLAPELLISAFFNQRIGEAVTAIAPSVNIHPSLLPQLKGVDPVFYARLRDAPLGVTVHRIAPELDSGEIIAQRSVPALPEESVLAATVRLYTLGGQLLIDSLERIRCEPGTRQTVAGSYDSWPKRSEIAALRRKGVKLVRLRDLLARAA